MPSIEAVPAKVPYASLPQTQTICVLLGTPKSEMQQLCPN